MLQETHSTICNENVWKAQWGGHIIFSHAESNARGVAIIFKRNLSYKILEIAKDTEGRILAIKLQVNDQQVVLANVYAPNSDQPQFFINAFSIIEQLGKLPMIVAGDFNTVLSISSDIKGGAQSTHKKCTAFLNEYMVQNDLVDVWRLRNPEIFQSTFVRTKPHILMERIDYILISSYLVQNVMDAHILPSFFSDHALLNLRIVSGFPPPGKGYWKMNVSLLEDKTVIARVSECF